MEVIFWKPWDNYFLNVVGYVGLFPLCSGSRLRLRGLNPALHSAVFGSADPNPAWAVAPGLKVAFITLFLHICVLLKTSEFYVQPRLVNF